MRIILAALVAAAVPAPAQSEPGVMHSRLFTTPDQRQRLDGLRRQPGRKSARPPPVDHNTPPIPVVNVQGVVLRSAGPATAWVNGHSVLHGARTVGGLLVQRGAGVEVRILLPNRESVTLLPGQSYTPASGKPGGIRIRKIR